MDNLSALGILANMRSRRTAHERAGICGRKLAGNVLATFPTSPTPRPPIPRHREQAAIREITKNLCGVAFWSCIVPSSCLYIWYRDGEQRHPQTAKEGH